MAALQNPFAADPVQAEVFELGYLTGFQDPDRLDPFEPFTPELLEVYVAGFDGRRLDASRAPVSDPAAAWIPKAQLSEEGIEELVEHVTIEAFFELTAHVFQQAAFGLAGLVISVVGIPGDVRLSP